MSALASIVETFAHIAECIAVLAFPVLVWRSIPRA